jgi:hypothetical protein
MRSDHDVGAGHLQFGELLEEHTTNFQHCLRMAMHGTVVGGDLDLGTHLWHRVQARTGKWYHAITLACEQRT